jgi:hypothetical protein
MKVNYKGKMVETDKDGFVEIDGQKYLAEMAEYGKVELYIVGDDGSKKFYNTAYEVKA